MYRAIMIVFVLVITTVLGACEPVYSAEGAARYPGEYYGTYGEPGYQDDPARYAAYPGPYYFYGGGYPGPYGPGSS